jgi:hypothetical protein
MKHSRLNFDTTTQEATIDGEPVWLESVSYIDEKMWAEFRVKKNGWRVKAPVTGVFEAS